MNSGKMYIRDPRELPFLREQAKMILALADSGSRGVSVREDDDFGFMAMQFLYKQVQHAEVLLMLEPRRDAGLVARTMIDGLYQLLWTTHEPETRARRWRSFSIIHDWRLIQGRLKENIPVEEAIIKQNELALKTFGHIHLLQKPKPGAADPYHRRWSGVTLSDMANVVGREMYDGPYSELFDWEHWGVSGIGESISRKDDHLTVDCNTERGTMLALLALFMCVVQTLQVVDVHFSLNLTAKLKQMIETFRASLDSFQVG